MINTVNGNAARAFVRKCAALMAVVMLLGSILGLTGLAEQGDAVERAIAGMSLRDKLCQMVFFSPRGWKEDPESEDPAQDVRALNEPLRKYIADHRFGGVLLFAENCRDAEETARLVADMQAANREGGGLPMLFAIDQEGGMVARLGFGTTGVGSMALAATGDAEYARRMAHIYGEELSLLGIQVDFAPVMDVNDNPANPVIAVRAFGDNPDTVTEYGLAYMQGLEEAGAIACVKHFPGHGNTDTDSHTGLPLVGRSREELMGNELVPFKAAIDAGVDMLMTAHIQLPELESQTYTSIKDGREIYIPATMSKTILTDLLRGELGYEGVIVSDALNMGAITDNFAVDDVFPMTINAGVNMLIVPSSYSVEDLDALDRQLDKAVAAAEDGAIDVERIDDSVRRILALKQAHGLLDGEYVAPDDAAVRAAVEGCGSAEHRQEAWDIACKALTLLRNENDAFPIRMAEGEKALILFTAGSRAGAGPLAASLLEDLDALPEGASIDSMVIEPDTAEDCIEAAKAADHVLLVSRAWSVAALDPATEDGYPVGVVNQIIDDLHAAGKTAVVVSAQMPYDAACYPGADAILLTYCSSAMRSVPNAAGEGSTWAPNLPAGICAAFGAVTPGGSLPIDLPRLDEAYHFTDETLYPAG